MPMKKDFYQRALSLFLAVLMVLVCVPTVSFAEDEGQGKLSAEEFRDYSVEEYMDDFEMLQVEEAAQTEQSANSQESVEEILPQDRTAYLSASIDQWRYHVSDEPALDFDRSWLGDQVDFAGLFQLAQAEKRTTYAVFRLNLLLNADVHEGDWFSICLPKWFSCLQAKDADGWAVQSVIAGSDDCWLSGTFREELLSGTALTADMEFSLDAESFAILQDMDVTEQEISLPGSKTMLVWQLPVQEEAVIKEAAIQKALSLLMLAPEQTDDNGIMLLAEGDNQQRSGSYQMNKNPNDYRFYTEYFIGTKTTAGIQRRTVAKVYLEKGERVYFGSSIADSVININETTGGTGVDIVMIMPSGVRKGFDVVRNGVGFIANPTQEANGPKLTAGDESNSSKYTPLYYDVQESGNYSFLFHSQRGATGTNPTAITTTQNWTNQGTYCVAAWDITVVSQQEDLELAEMSLFEDEDLSAEIPEEEFSEALPEEAAQGEIIIEPQPETEEELPEQPTAEEVPAVEELITENASEEAAAMLPAAEEVQLQEQSEELELQEPAFEQRGRAALAAIPDWILPWENYEVKLGRVWADYLALTTGADGKAASLEVYVLTNDGHIYEVNLQDIMPWGFIFFANSMGFTTTGDKPASIYHSFYDNDNNIDKISDEEYVTVRIPDSSVTNTTQQTFRVFFNYPAGELRPQPQQPSEVKNLRLESNAGSGVAHYSQGGRFSFETSQACTVTIEIDLRKVLEEMLADPNTSDEQLKILQDYQKKGSGVIVINGSASTGSNFFPWNGKDSAGVSVPCGAYKQSEIVVNTVSKNGEIHFPMLDAEGFRGGIRIERLTNPDETSFDAYYNNNPLAYGTIEGKGTPVNKSGSYCVLSDGTRSYGNPQPGYFTGSSRSISTLVKDDDTEFVAYHHVPVNTSQETMTYSSSGSTGGGNQAGIDVWTYYSNGAGAHTIATDFAIIPAPDSGEISGTIFNDKDSDTIYKPTGDDRPLKGVTIRLVDKNGVPASQKVELPKLDDEGRFVLDSRGEIVWEKTTTYFETTTDADGIYTFTGVPYGTYYAQVLLTDAQENVLEYLPTTTTKALGVGYLKNGVTAIDPSSGADGASVTLTKKLMSTTTVFDAVYARNAQGETVFDKNNAQSVTISAAKPTASFKNIGYVTGVPLENQKNYRIRKEWASGTTPLSNVTVELYYWDPEGELSDVHHAAGSNLRSGVLLDTQKLSAANGWEYTWMQMDDRLQYYFIEYYTKRMDNGEIQLNDQGQERMVLIGGTMPLYSHVSELMYYPAGLDYYNGHQSDKEPVHYFGDTVPYHPDATTEMEKQTTSDFNALLYDVNYTLLRSEDTYTTILQNSQVYDETQYYVWKDHERELPHFIRKTTGVSSDGTRNYVSEKLSRNPDGTIAGLTATCLDNPEPVRGDSTGMFTVKADGQTVAYYTGTQPGTHTYRMEYGVHSWTTTIHVYDVEPDEIFYYNPFGNSIQLQQGLYEGDTLTWTRVDGEYFNDDTRTRTLEDGAVSGTNAVFGNDIYRVTTYASSLNPDMGSCADLVGIAYSPNGVVSASEAAKLTYSLTDRGSAESYGKGGALTVDLNLPRSSKTGNTQDHLNYANINFQPNATYKGEDGDIFYYMVIVYDEAIVNTFRDPSTIDATQGVVMYTYVKVKPIDIKGELVITKSVTGNFGDPDRLFAMDITLTAPEGGAADDIHYSGGFNAGGKAVEAAVIPGGWSGSQTVTVWVRHESKVWFQDLPRGITYRISEQDVSSDGYSLPKMSFVSPDEEDFVHTGTTWDDTYAEGTVQDPMDEVHVVNTKDIYVGIGTEMDNTPFGLLAVVVLIVVLLLVSKLHPFPILIEENKHGRK